VADVQAAVSADMLGGGRGVSARDAVGLELADDCAGEYPAGAQVPTGSREKARAEPRAAEELDRLQGGYAERKTARGKLELTCVRTHDVHRERVGATRKLRQQSHVHVHARNRIPGTRQRERYATGAAAHIEHGGTGCSSSEFEPQGEVGAIVAALKIVPDHPLLG
jgi:hypothetical protein